MAESRNSNRNTNLNRNRNSNQNTNLNRGNASNKKSSYLPIEEILYNQSVSRWEKEMEKQNFGEEPKSTSRRTSKKSTLERLFPFLGRKKKKNKKKKPLQERIVIYIARFAVVGIVLFGVREFVSYSNIGFIKKYRELYIQTAMSTHSHQWLATWVFPRRVVNDVQRRTDEALAKQAAVESNWTDELDKLGAGKKGKEWFYEVFSELDGSKSFASYIDDNPDALDDGWENIKIKDLDGDYDIYTTNGDKVLVVDAANNIMIIEIEGDGFVGKMAFVKNPSQIQHVLAETYGSRGEEIETFAAEYDAVLAINASGFDDVGGHGSGATPRGAVIIDGVEYGNPLTYQPYKLYAMDYEGKLNVTNYRSEDVANYRWGVQFFPALIVDGEVVADDDVGLGLQPRTCVGQCKDGTFLFLVIDGRQAGYSNGAQVSDCATVLKRYDAYQAGNFDGGSSSIMVYEGEMITSPSSQSGHGRFCPDAMIVIHANEVDGWVDKLSKFPK